MVKFWYFLCSSILFFLIPFSAYANNQIDLKVGQVDGKFKKTHNLKLDAAFEFNIPKQIETSSEPGYFDSLSFRFKGADKRYRTCFYSRKFSFKSIRDWIFSENNPHNIPLNRCIRKVKTDEFQEAKVLKLRLHTSFWRLKAKRTYTLSLQSPTNQELSEVPALIGKNEAEAKNLIEASGFVIGNVDDAFSSEPIGIVLNQSPNAGSLLALGSQVGITISKGPEKVVVPNVAGLALDPASDQLNAAGLQNILLTDKYSETVEKGLVIGSIPLAGTEVEVTSEIILEISLGKAPRAVPNIIGEASTNAAESKLAAEGFKLGTITEVFSSQSVGTVLSQTPIPGEIVEYGSLVSIEISKGPEPITIANFAGRSLLEVKTELEAVGLIVESSEDFSLTVANGNIISQDPAEGSLVPVGGAITLVVSKGLPDVIMPDLASKTEAEAIELLEQVYLTANIALEFSNSIPLGQVIEQFPMAGSTLKAKSTVEVTVSQGPRQVEVPDLNGKTLNVAQAILEALNLNLGLVTEVDSQKPKGEIVAQQIQPGLIVDELTTIAVHVSKGPKDAIIPDLVGLGVEDAKAALDAANLNYSLNRQTNLNYAKDNVFESDPSSGEIVKEGFVVDLFISDGAIVPNLVGETEGSARRIATQFGLQLEVSYISSETGTNRVVTQSPPAGDTYFYQGMYISLTVEESTKFETIPDLTGKSEEEAKQTLSSLGFQNILVVDSTSDAEQVEKVTDQSPKAGSKVNLAWNISIHVSRGSTDELIVGEDTDQDGIRDDLANVVEDTYTTDQNRKIAREYLKEFSKSLSYASKGNEFLAKRSSSFADRIISCIDISDQTELKQKTTALIKATVNTKDRLLAFIRLKELTSFGIQEVDLEVAGSEFCGNI